MKHKILIWIGVLILLCGVVSATQYGVKEFFEGASPTAPTWTLGGGTCTGGELLYANVTTPIEGSQSAYGNGGGWFCSKPSDFGVNSGGSVIMVKVNISSRTGSAGTYITSETGTDDSAVRLYDADTSCHDGVGDSVMGFTATENKVYLVVMNRSATQYTGTVYIIDADGGLGAVQGTPCTRNLGGSSNIIGLANYDNKGVRFDGYVTYNGTLFTETIYDEFYPVGSATKDTLNISNYNPKATSFQTSAVNINVSLNATYNFSCYMQINGTVNFTGTGSAGNDKTLNITRDFNGGSYAYNWTCFTNETSENVTSTFYVDYIVPSINTNFASGSVFKVGSGNVSYYFNFSDETQVHSVNISIDGITLFNRSGIDNKTFYYNYPLNISNLSAGYHYINASVWDGHTATELKCADCYNPDTGFLIKNELNYRLRGVYSPLDIKIYLKEYSIFDEWAYKQEKDRFTESVKPYSEKETQVIVVESSKPLYVAHNPIKYGGMWLITGKTWKDFVLTGENAGASIKDIKLVSQNKAEVTITGIKNPKLIEFSSTGDLNYYSVAYNFSVYNYTLTYSQRLVEGGTYDFNFTIDKYGSYDASATLMFNATNYTSTKTTGSTSIRFSSSVGAGQVSGGMELLNQSFSFNWTYNITGDVNTSNITATQNTTIFKVALSNCSNYSDTIGLNISTIDESTGLAVNSATSVLYSAWYQNPNYARNHSWKYLVSPSSRWCVYPTIVNVSNNAQYLFSATGYASNNYYVFDENFPNETKYITIYLINSSLGSYISITVLDYLSNPVQGLLVEAHKYDLATNNYTLIRTEITDVSGLVKMLLLTSDNEYRFLVKNDTNDVVYTSEKMKLFSDSYTFRLEAPSSTEVPYYDIENFDCPITYNTLTTHITATYNDLSSIANLYTFKVFWNNVSNDTLLYENSSALTSNTFYYDLNNASGLFAGNFYITHKNDNVSYLICTYNVDNRQDWQVWGKEGAVLSWLFIGTLTFIGITISPTVALILLAIGFVVMGIAGFINISTGIGGIVSFIVLIIILIARERR